MHYIELYYYVIPDDEHPESLPNEPAVSEYDYSSGAEYLFERLVPSNPKKIPSSRDDSGFGKSATRTQTKKSEFSEVNAVNDALTVL